MSISRRLINVSFRLLRAGPKPWVFFCLVVALWALAAYLVIYASSALAGQLGLFGLLGLGFILSFISERFWGRYLNRVFVDETAWLWSWVVIAAVPVLLGLAFRASLNDMQSASPGMPDAAHVHAFAFVFYFFLGPWSWATVVCRLLCIGALCFGFWGSHINTVSRTNYYNARIMAAYWKARADAMRKDVEKRRFGPHRNLFEDN